MVPKLSLTKLNL